MNTRRWKMDGGGCLARSVMECGGWRGIGLTPLWLCRGFELKRRRRFALPARSKTGACLVVLLLCACAPAFAQNYSLDWFTIDGGGGTSTGGVYQVSGTVGQPDAGPAMSGGNYSVDGGFWSIIAAVQTPGAPTLTVTLTTTNTAVVSWPYPSTGFALEQNPTIGTTNWTSVTNTVSNDGSFNRVVVPANTGNKFYRLKK